jgi:predicted transcriptional regulator
MADPLNPTLWRTCRMLANARRLRIIHHLIDREPQTLTQLAKACKMSISACSQYTRQITARGICREIRNGRFAYFDLYPDPAISYSELLLESLIRSLKLAKQNYKGQIADLTAYTHVSRMRIVRHIKQHGVTSTSEMKRVLHISRPALLRHIQKLKRRNTLEAVKTGGYQLRQPKTILAKALLVIATGQLSHTS